METITRHRPGSTDRYGVTSPETHASVIVREVEPLTGQDIIRQRVEEDTVTFTCRLYTLTPVDVIDGDQVTVRGKRYQHVQVSEWRATGIRFTGYAILCGGGHG